MPLTTEALAVLRGLPTPLDRSQTVFLYRGGPLIRYSPNGHRNGRHEKPWRRACLTAGIEHVGPHITRHTFASEFLANGGAISDLCRIGGWSNSAMIDKTYGHLCTGWVDRVLKAAERIA